MASWVGLSGCNVALFGTFLVTDNEVLSNVTGHCWESCHVAPPAETVMDKKLWANMERGKRQVDD